MTDDEVEDIIYNKLGYCICASSNSLLLVQKILEYAKLINSGDRCQDWNKFVKETCYSDESIAYCLCFLCENADLMEHGIAIRHPWLTETGESFLDFIANGGLEKLEKGEQL